MATASIAAGSLTQHGRLLQIDTTLGPDTFVVRSFHVHEAISELFEFNLELASENFQIVPSKIIAQQVTIRAVFDDSDERPFHGFVSRFSMLPSEDHLAHYRMRIVPSLWFLARTSNCAIFQNKTTPEIVEAIFKRYSVSNYKMEMTGSYAKREYCVQYREPPLISSRACLKKRAFATTSSTPPKGTRSSWPTARPVTGLASCSPR